MTEDALKYLALSSGRHPVVDWPIVAAGGRIVT